MGHDRCCCDVYLAQHNKRAIVDQRRARSRGADGVELLALAAALNKPCRTHISTRELAKGFGTICLAEGGEGVGDVPGIERDESSAL